MLRAIQLKTGKWTLENTKTGDCFWDTLTFDTQEQAEADAADRNAKWEAGRAKYRKESAESRKNYAELKKSIPTEMLTSRGDGWEGNSSLGNEPI